MGVGSAPLVPPGAAFVFRARGWLGEPARPRGPPPHGGGEYHSSPHPPGGGAGRDPGGRAAAARAGRRVAGEAARARGGSVSAARKLSGSGELPPTCAPTLPARPVARKTGWGPLGWVGVGVPGRSTERALGGGGGCRPVAPGLGGGVPRDPRARRCFLLPTPYPATLPRGPRPRRWGWPVLGMEWGAPSLGRGPPEVAGDCDTWGSLKGSPHPTPGRCDFTCVARARQDPRPGWF